MKTKRKKAQVFTAADLVAGNTIHSGHYDGRHHVFIFIHLGYLHIQVKDASGQVVTGHGGGAWLWQRGSMGAFKRFYRELTGQPYIGADDTAHEGMLL